MPRAVTTTIMKLAVVAGLSLLALSTTAHAGGYVSAGIGPQPAFGGEIEGGYSGDGHNSARVMVGKRFGMVGLEAGVGGFGFTGTAQDTADTAAGAKMYNAQLAVTLTMPLMVKLDGYVRGGVEKSWASGEVNDGIDITGDGWVIGAGAAYNLGMHDAALWAELNHEMVTYEHTGNLTREGVVDTLMVGVRFGFGK